MMLKNRSLANRLGRWARLQKFRVQRWRTRVPLKDQRPRVASWPGVPVHIRIPSLEAAEHERYIRPVRRFWKCAAVVALFAGAFGGYAIGRSVGPASAVEASR